jgi:hypothetical protein
MAAGRAKHLSDWFSERAALKQRSGVRDAGRFLEGFGQCEAFLDLLEATKATQLTRDQIRTLVSIATDEAGSTPVFPAEAGLATVRAPGAVVDAAERILWWSFRRDTAPSIRALPLTLTERAALADAGIVLPDPGAEAVAHAESWRRPLLCARQHLVLVCPSDGADGEEVFPHPLWDEVVANLASDSMRGSIERFVTPFFSEVKRKRRKSLALVTTPSQLQVEPELITARETESPSSLGNLVGCPLRWVLEYVGHLEDTLTVDVSASNLNLGNLAHHIIEQFLLRTDLDADGDHAEEQAGAFFDQVAPRLLSALYLPGADNAREQVRQAIARSAADLARFVREHHLTVLSVEKEYQSKALGRQVHGYADLVLGPSPLIIDLKWSGASFHQESLASGTAYQLAAYSFLVGKETKQSFPPVSYFIVQNQRCLSTDPKAFIDAEVTDGPSPKDTWSALTKTSASRYKELKEGVVIRPEPHEPRRKQATGIVDSHLVLAPPCHFCSYGVVCGAAVGG